MCRQDLGYNFSTYVLRNMLTIMTYNIVCFSDIRPGASSPHAVLRGSFFASYVRVLGVSPGLCPPRSMRRLRFHLHNKLHTNHPDLQKNESISFKEEINGTINVLTALSCYINIVTKHNTSKHSSYFVNIWILFQCSPTDSNFPHSNTHTSARKVKHNLVTKCTQPRVEYPMCGLKCLFYNFSLWFYPATLVGTLTGKY